MCRHVAGGGNGPPPSPRRVSSRAALRGGGVGACTFRSRCSWSRSPSSSSPPPDRWRPSRRRGAKPRSSSRWTCPTAWPPTDVKPSRIGAAKVAAEDFVRRAAARCPDRGRGLRPERRDRATTHLRPRRRAAGHRPPVPGRWHVLGRGHPHVARRHRRQDPDHQRRRRSPRTTRPRSTSGTTGGRRSCCSPMARTRARQTR